MVSIDFDKLRTDDKEELLKIIYSTRSKMSRLRNKMEHPNYSDKDKLVSPSDLVVYNCLRDFYYSAIGKYVLVGGDYKPPRVEINDFMFNDKLDDIVKITFFNGGCFSVYDKIIIDLSGDKVKVLKGSFSEVSEKANEIDKEVFLYDLEELHIGEWRCHYSAKRFGMEICDGVQWALKFEYKDGKKKTYGGDNAFPYNFDELLDLLCV